jgi:hypothetical protein
VSCLSLNFYSVFIQGVFHMGMSSPDSNATPENNAPKSVTLKCDKPRYDGGVEVNLERYFGRPLQPNRQLLEQRLRQHQSHAASQASTPSLAELKETTPPAVEAPCKATPAKEMALTEAETVALTPPTEQASTPKAAAKQHWFCKSLATCAEWGMWLGMLQLLVMSLLYARLMKQDSLTQPMVSTLSFDKLKLASGLETMLQGFALRSLWPFGKPAKKVMPVG